MSEFILERDHMNVKNARKLSGSMHTKENSLLSLSGKIPAPVKALVLFAFTRHTCVWSGSALDINGITQFIFFCFFLLLLLTSSHVVKCIHLLSWW